MPEMEAIRVPFVGIQSGQESKQEDGGGDRSDNDPPKNIRVSGKDGKRKWTAGLKSSQSFGP
jgi:hypothetical protein